MADEVRRVQYAYLTVKDQPGAGAEILGALKAAGVNLQAFTGFPARAGRVQIDLVTDDLPGLKRVARDRKWKLSRVKRGFLVQGEDRVGAVAEVLEKLAASRINVTAADAVSAGAGRYGMVLWVKPASYSRAARALGAGEEVAMPSGS